MATNTTEDTVAKSIREEILIAKNETLIVTQVSTQVVASPDVKSVVTPDVLKNPSLMVPYG